MVYDPERRGGERRADLAEVVDIYPSLLDLLRLPIPPDIHGATLFSGPEQEIAAAEGDGAKVILGDWSGFFPWDEWTPDEMFDLSDDPLEQNPVAGEAAEKQRATLVAAFREWREEIKERERHFEPLRHAIPEEVRRQLERLGYTQ